MYAPIFIPLDWEETFHIYVDAYNVAIASILIQKDEKYHDHPIYFANYQIMQVELNYIVTEHEALRIGFLLQNFFYYLLGNKFVFHVNHDALKHVINTLQLSGQIARWVVLLQIHSGSRTRQKSY